MAKENNFLNKDHIQGRYSVRVSRILNEFIDGFKFIKKYNKTVTFFGSSRVKPNTKYYQEALSLSSMLSKKGYTIVTGGGKGIMEAANRGAYLSNGNSVGINIELMKGEKKNRYVKDSICFRYFFVRKVMLTFTAQAYIFFPGGFGTLDEFFEIVTLVQTRKVKKIPIILVDKSYWEPLLEWIDQILYKNKKTVSKKDISLFRLVNSIEEASKILK